MSIDKKHKGPRNKGIFDLVRKNADIGTKSVRAEIARLARIARKRGIVFSINYVKYAFRSLRGDYRKRRFVKPEKREAVVASPTVPPAPESPSKSKDRRFKRDRELLRQLDEINEMLQQREDAPTDVWKKKNRDG